MQTNIPGTGISNHRPRSLGHYRLSFHMFREGSCGVPTVFGKGRLEGVAPPTFNDAPSALLLEQQDDRTRSTAVSHSTVT